MDDDIKIIISRLRHDITKDATFYDKKVGTEGQVPVSDRI